MTKFFNDKIDVQITHHKDVGEFQLEAFPLTIHPLTGEVYDTEQGITLALDHQVGDLPKGMDDDWWVGVQRDRPHTAPSYISTEVWDRFVGIAFDKLTELTGN